MPMNKNGGSASAKSGNQKRKQNVVVARASAGPMRRGDVELVIPRNMTKNPTMALNQPLPVSVEDLGLTMDGGNWLAAALHPNNDAGWARIAIPDCSTGQRVCLALVDDFRIEPGLGARRQTRVPTQVKSGFTPDGPEGGAWTSGVLEAAEPSELWGLYLLTWSCPQRPLIAIAWRGPDVRLAAERGATVELLLREALLAPPNEWQYLGVGKANTPPTSAYAVVAYTPSALADLYIEGADEGQLTTRCNKFRVAAQGVTTHLIASALTDQGEVIAAQFPISERVVPSTAFYPVGGTEGQRVLSVNNVTVLNQLMESITTQPAKLDDNGAVTSQEVRRGLVTLDGTDFRDVNQTNLTRVFTSENLDYDLGPDQPAGLKVHTPRDRLIFHQPGPNIPLDELQPSGEATEGAAAARDVNPAQNGRAAVLKPGNSMSWQSRAISLPPYSPAAIMQNASGKERKDQAKFGDYTPLRRFGSTWEWIDSNTNYPLVWESQTQDQFSPSPIVTNAEQAAIATEVATTARFPIDSKWAMAVSYWSGLSVASTLTTKHTLALEAVTAQSTPWGPFGAQPPLDDPAALRMYQQVCAKLPYSWEAKFNDWGQILRPIADTLLNVLPLPGVAKTLLGNVGRAASDWLGLGSSGGSWRPLGKMQNPMTRLPTTTGRR